MLTWAVAVFAWLALGLPVALIIGMAIRERGPAYRQRVINAEQHLGRRLTFRERLDLTD